MKCSMILYNATTWTNKDEPALKSCQLRTRTRTCIRIRIRIAIVPHENGWMDQWRRPLISSMKLSSITRKVAFTFRTLAFSIIFTPAAAIPNWKSSASFNLRILNLHIIKNLLHWCMWACELHVQSARKLLELAPICSSIYFFNRVSESYGHTGRCLRRK